MASIPQQHHTSSMQLVGVHLHPRLMQRAGSQLGSNLREGKHMTGMRGWGEERPGGLTCTVSPAAKHSTA